MKPYYEDESVIIIHGDCREVLPSMPSWGDSCLTSPPYNVRKSYPCDDWPSWEEYFTFVRGVYQMLRATVSGPIAYVYPFCLNAELDGSLLVPWGRDGIPWKRVRLILRHDAVDDSKSLIAMPPRVEVLVCDQWAEENGAKIWHVPHAKFGADHGQKFTLDHPAPFHSKMANKFFEMFPSVGKVIDPFCGTGTVLRAAKDWQRKAIGIEIEERYCEIAAKRMAQEVLPLSSKETP